LSAVVAPVAIRDGRDGGRVRLPGNELKVASRRPLRQGMKGADQHGGERGGAQASEPAEHRNQPHLSLQVLARSQGPAREDEAPHPPGNHHRCAHPGLGLPGDLALPAGRKVREEAGREVWTPSVQRRR
jgi:hypothetical protein